MDSSAISSMEKDQILSADLIDAIYEEEDEVLRQELINFAEERAKNLKCRKQFLAMVKAQQKKIDAARKEIEKETTLPVEQHIYTVTLPGEDGEDDVVTYNTGKWMVSDKGIVAQGNDKSILASYYPIIITKCLTNRETAEEKLELRWKKKGETKTLAIKRDIISTSKDITKLSVNGFPATSENAKHIVRYLADFEALNDIPHEVSTGKYGWVKDEFVPYTSKIMFDGTSDIKYLSDSMQTHGDYREWMKLIKEVRASGRKEPLVYLAASFGSILLHGLNIDPFIVNLYGETGKGKTVSLMLAASVWANPSGRGYISESTSTLNALEIKLNALNHLPLMIDDLSKVRGEKKKLTDIIYYMCAGGGKNRLTRGITMRAVPTWKNIILSNIERPLTDDTMQGGSLNRVLDFEIEAGDIYKDGNHVVSVLVKHYGYAGMAFVEAVRNVGWDAIREKVEYYRVNIKERGELLGDPKEDKQIMPLAVLLTADWLSEQEIFHDDVRIDFDYGVRMLKGKRQVSEMERAYLHFVDAYHINHQKFDDDNSYSDCWGKKMVGSYVAVIPTALDKIAEMYNFSVSQFIAWCKKTDRLSFDSGRNQKWANINGERVRCYVIRIDDTLTDTVVIYGDQDMLPDEPIPFDMTRL